MVQADLADLDGWADDDLSDAADAYTLTQPPDWPVFRGGDPRTFFRSGFRANQAAAPKGLLTGYYEPVLEGSLVPTAGFRAALYSAPADLPVGRLWATRTEIETGDLLRGHEIVFVADPADAFFAQVQGSVRVALPDGCHLRLGYSAKNGHPYRSIGAELIARAEISPQDMSAQAIRGWCRAHPDSVADLLRTNPSFVFFKLRDLPDAAGPVGSAGVPLTAMRSLAVDPGHIPLGTPVWIETPGPDPIRRLCIAQDTGSAIRGPQRADLFCGTGEAAGRSAGSLNAPLRITPLFPARTAGAAL